MHLQMHLSMMRLRMFYWFIRSAAEIFSCYVGEAEAIVRSLFARARACSPCVLFIDEIDALVGSRSFGGSGESGGDVVQGRVLASFLTEMDGIGASDAGVVLVGATNRLEVRFETTIFHGSNSLQLCVCPSRHTIYFHNSRVSVHRCGTSSTWSL